VVRIHSGVPFQHIRVRIGYALPVGLEVLLAPFSLRHSLRKGNIKTRATIILVKFQSLTEAIDTATQCLEPGL
jgi:hypothetical protein